MSPDSAYTGPISLVILFVDEVTWSFRRISQCEVKLPGGSVPSQFPGHSRESLCGHLSRNRIPMAFQGPKMAAHGGDGNRRVSLLSVSEKVIVSSW
jgi:hypothetical protein